MKRIVLLVALLTIMVMPTLANDSTYLNFTAVNGPATIKMLCNNSSSIYGMEYSTDNCATWNTYNLSQTIQLPIDSTVFFRNTSANYRLSSSRNIYYYVMTGAISADGSVMSLLGANLNCDSVPQYAFCKLFSGCTSLVQAPALPATNLRSYCYESMFYGCTSLVQAPALPATNLGSYCYESMFYGCTSLVQAPALPATNLDTSCYESMFNGCTSLTQVPSVLPATVLAYSCYNNMFQSCTSLSVAPALPATTLADFCYNNMFQGCTSLIQAPSLPAVNLAPYCYNYMFSKCTSLSTIPTLPATNLSEGCYRYMFSSCSSLIVNTHSPGTQWIIRAANDGNQSLQNMFSDTGGEMCGTPTINTMYYITQYVDTAEADVYFYYNTTINSVEVAEYNMIMYKGGGRDTLDVRFANDTSFVMNRLPRVITIVDSVTGSTTTVTISINCSFFDANVNEIGIHLKHLAANKTYYVIIMPLDKSGNVLARDEYSFTTISDANNPKEEDEYDDTDDFFPTDQTDVYTLDGRYIGKYYLDLPPGVYLMRDKGRWHKFGKVR